MTENGKPLTHYEILGVDHSATMEEIRTAWRRLTLKWHPDRGPATGTWGKDEAEMHIREINAAYECLSTPELKQAYDDGKPDEYKLRQDAKDSLLMAVNNAVMSTANFIMRPILVTVRQEMTGEIARGTHQHRDLMSQIGNIERAEKRIRRKNPEGANLIGHVIVQQLGSLKATAQMLAVRGQVLAYALQMLDEYVEDPAVSESSVPAAAPKVAVTPLGLSYHDDSVPKYR